MQNPYAINSSKIESLLRRFITRTYSSYDSKQDSYDQTIIDTCIHFWQRDYVCEIIENKNGDLCSTYPSRIPVPIQEHAVDGKIVNKSVLSVVSKKALKQRIENYLDEPNSKCKLESGSDKSNNLDTTDSCLDRRALAFDNPDDIHFSTVFHNTIGLKNGNHSKSFAEIINSSQSEIKTGLKNNIDNIHDSTGSLDQYRSDKMTTLEDADIIHIKDPNEQNELISSPSRELRTLPTFIVSEKREIEVLHSSLFESVPLTRLHEAPNSIGQDSNSLTNYIKRSIKARCWYRFPVPSILCNNKFVCRSATISCFVDVCGKSIWEKLDFSCESCEILEEELGPDHAHGLAEARSNDIRLLKKLAVSAIMDLMVEIKKKKWGFKSCSSEKADSEKRYSDFNIFSIPYPGCEFFTEFTKNQKSSENLYYNWEPSFNDAKLTIPEAMISPKICTNWNNYKEWDLRTLTENYLKLILGHITEEDVNESGLLIHCISGWDRTPLFISLIRLTLWADGLIHSSLNAKEMLYFTLAYDWYLFGHNLPDRLKSEENILYFCFEFLDVIGNESFMDMSERRMRHPSNGSSASGAYDSATEGNETTASSSFGSVTSLASSSSNPPSVASLAPNIKVSSLKQTSESVLSGLWPFNKENGFSFEGIADNDPPVNLSSGTENTLHIKKYSKNSPVRSPLKEHNKGSPKTTPSPSSKRGSGRRANLNGVLRESSMGKRSRKSSTDSLGSRVGERPTSESSTSTEEFVNVSDSESVHSTHHLKDASTPVPVPGGRSRHNSSSSVGGSWQMISAPEDSVSYSFESVKSFCKASSTTEMIDSTHTIREEVSPSSSAGSSHSITVFNRKRRLSKVREIFVEVYRRLNESKKS